MRHVFCVLGALAAALCFGMPRPASADEIDAIRARGALVCAISHDVDDWSRFDVHGDLSAFSTDLCRAVAAALLPGGTRTQIIGTADEITALRDVHDGKADIAFGTTPDPALGYQFDVAFTEPLLIDGQSFLYNRDENFSDLASLRDRRLCFIGGTPEGELLKTRMAELRVPFIPFAFNERGEMIGALATGHCNAVTGDVTELATQRLNLPALARDGVIMPLRITTDPWSPVVRADARRLFATVSAVTDGLLAADTIGITQANAAALSRTASDPVVARLLGASSWQARGLGLDERFLLRAIEAVGTYDELYRRDVGAGSPFKLPVGPNTSVAEGGALASIPVSSER